MGSGSVSFFVLSGVSSAQCRLLSFVFFICADAVQTASAWLLLALPSGIQCNQIALDKGADRCVLVAFSDMFDQGIDGEFGHFLGALPDNIGDPLVGLAVDAGVVIQEGNVKVIEDTDFEIGPVVIFCGNDQVAEMLNVKSGENDKGRKFFGRIQQGIDRLFFVVPVGINDLIVAGKAVLVHGRVVAVQPFQGYVCSFLQRRTD